MNHKPTVHTYFDNRNNQMLCRDSSRFFECEYDLDQRGTRLEFFTQLRQTVKENHVFFCGCCKRPLKISGGNANGKKCFHFQHLTIPEKDECKYYDKIPMTKEEIKAMIFYGRVEGAKHREIKNIIGKALEQDPLAPRVAIEEVARKIGKAWRKPDIRADFNDKTVVFEVQLSPIFHNVIMERNQDYRANNWYICWVFDKIDEEEPLLRTLDAWANNNYNVLIFDEAANRETLETGVLHFTVKYTSYHLEGNDENTSVQSKWETDLVEFNSLTFDKEKMMIYLFDSEKQKAEMEAERDKIIEEAKMRKRFLEQKRVENQQFYSFIRSISTYSFPDSEYRRLLRRLNELDSEETDCILKQVKGSLSTFSPDALNKWLVVVHAIYDKRRNDESEQEYTVDITKLLESLWNWTQFVYSEKELGFIKELALIDYIHIFGIESSFRALTFLEQPIDERTSQLLCSIKRSDEKFNFYAPLIVLDRYNHAKGYVPHHIIEVFMNNSQQTFWCLASIKAGRPMGYYCNYKNLKDIVNVICNSYSYIAKQALYMIDKYNRRDELTVSTAKLKPGRTYRNQYERLQMCAASSETCELSNEDIDILFPSKALSPAPSN